MSLRVTGPLVLGALLGSLSIHGCSEGSSAIDQSSAAPLTLPAQFSDALVANVDSPTALAFLPDGRLLIGSQKGQIRVVRDGALKGAAALDLSPSICTNSERGVLGIAVDPEFASNKQIFVYYTAKKHNSCATNDAKNGPVNRVSRFVYDLSSDKLSGESILLDDILSLGGNHNGGDLHFGADKNLYISVGDSGCQLNDSSKCGGANKNSTSRSLLNGKILRIARDGSIPGDNPWLNDSGARRCGDPKGTPSYEISNSKPCVETYAWGLRNPFRFAFAPDGKTFYIDDVGQNVSEEIDVGEKGANYGWPTREGYCANNVTPCTGGSAPSGLKNPLFSWDRNVAGVTKGCASITGGAFVPSGAFGSAFEGAYLFGDYVCGKIFALSTAGQVTSFVTALGSSSAVTLLFGPDPSGRTSLYFTTYANGGEIHRLSFTGAANRVPVAKLSASPASGEPPLNVLLDGRASSDPDSGDTLSYQWSFGDGSAAQTTSAATINHNYANKGTFTATLTVSDNHGGKSSAVGVKIVVGNTAPSVSIVSPAPNKTFFVGEKLTLKASASDLEDGTLTGNALSWTVLRHHDQHTHPYFSGTGESVTIDGAAPEDLLAAGNSYLELQVTAKDSGGLSTTITQDLLPKTVDLTFQSQPAGLTLTLDSTTDVVTPSTVTSWQGFDVRAKAGNQGAFVFASWSDNGAAEHVIHTPTTPTTYTATFTQSSGKWSAKINFQPASAPVPTGYLVDDGSAFGAHNGLSYGWSGDNTANTRDRDAANSADQRYDTLIHMQKTSLPDARWEIQLPNGSYDVHVVQGDPGHIDSTFALSAEGKVIASGTPTAQNHWVEGHTTVNVSDGRLTLANGSGATNNKLCFVDIQQL
jgi:glucose/arabinose dehydrogenase